MKNLTKLGLLLLFWGSALSGQTFDKTVLVDIPGDNYDFDFVTGEWMSGNGSYILWVNKNDSVYTVYLKKISPEIDNENIVVSSGTEVKLNPQIAYNSDYSGVRIIWENYKNDSFQIVERDYLNDSLSGEIIIEDSLNEDPQVSLSASRLIWIKNGALVETELFSGSSEQNIIDSANCASPNIAKNDFYFFSQIVYIKNEDNESKIYAAEYNSALHQVWSPRLITDGNNANPNVGYCMEAGGVSFEKIENGISKIWYSDFGTVNFYVTGNYNCNYKNPTVFSYAIPTNNVTTDKTPFFLAFDTDSLENNNEVFIKTFYFGMYDSLINVSETEGDDFLPKIGLITLNNTIYVAIVWLHRENDKTDIWMAKTVFDPIANDVEKADAKPGNFVLEQNFPNPFNPSTTIKYSIPNIGGVETLHATSLRIYNLLGKEIATLVNKKQAPGNYTVQFDASNLPSGVYFYTLRAGEFSITRKMLLLK